MISKRLGFYFHFLDSNKLKSKIRVKYHVFKRECFWNKLKILLLLEIV
jgi:hypothetical protein